MSRESALLLPLTEVQLDTAALWLDGEPRPFQGALWQSNTEHPFRLQVDDWATHQAGALYGDLLRNVTQITTSPLSGLCRRLGLHGATGQLDGKRMAYAEVPAFGKLTRRISDLNADMPARQQLPEFVSFAGGEYSGRQFAETLLANGGILMADETSVARGTPEDQDQQSVLLSSAHDQLLIHLFSWLCVGPAGRAAIADSFAEAMLRDDKGEDTDHLGRAMAIADLQISAIALGACVQRQDFSRLSGIFGHFPDIDEHRADRVARDTWQHIGYLTAHFPPI